MYWLSRLQPTATKFGERQISGAANFGSDRFEEQQTLGGGKLWRGPQIWGSGKF